MTKTNWIRSTRKDLALEYHLEWKNKRLWLIYGQVFKSIDDFVKAYEASPAITVKPSTDAKIAYRSRTKTRDALISLISSYRSWPEYRNHETVERLYKGVKGGRDKIPYPIIFEKGGRKRIFSGNTRADVAMQIHGEYKAVLIDIDSLEVPN